MKRVLVIIARLALAGVFLWAAIAKLRDPWMLFAMQLDTMQLFSERIVVFVARTLPWTELLLGIVLLAGIKMRYAASFSTALLIVFLGVMTTLYIRGFQGDCGCFGPGEQLGPKTLARDAALLAVSAWITFEAFRSRRVDTIEPTGI